MIEPPPWPAVLRPGAPNRRLNESKGSRRDGPLRATIRHVCLAALSAAHKQSGLLGVRVFSTHGSRERLAVNQRSND